MYLVNTEVQASEDPTNFPAPTQKPYFEHSLWNVPHTQEQYDMQIFNKSSKTDRYST